MTRFIFNFILISCLSLRAAFAGDNDLKDFKKDQARIADAIEKVPASEMRLFLYSLDPHDASRFGGKLPENSAKSFHWMPILGCVEIVPFQEKTNLLGALAQGVRASDSIVANCFDPRHGLRIVTKSSTNDFVICFECLQVQAYGFAPSSYFLTGNSPAATFNNLLDEYKIKKAE
jgi:hypothetical protein